MRGRSRVRQAKRSREQWLAVISEQSASGQTAREFCDSHGLSISTFCTARRRAKAAGADVGRSTGTGGEFVSVTLDDVQPADSSSGRWDVELTLGVGVVLRLRSV